MAFRARLRIENRRNLAYDSRHNVETAREEYLGHMGLAADAVKAGNSVYRVTWAWLIERALARLDIDAARYTFIDYGSGKGKAMLMAAEHPFRSIIGLEYAAPLHAIAAENCLSYVNPRQRCYSLQPILANVLDYTPPPGPIVCFMCNPFDLKTMRSVFKSWRRRYEGGERDIRVLYLNMRDIGEVGDVLDEQNWLQPVARERRFVLLAPRKAQPSGQRSVERKLVSLAEQ
jgi:hypothetical protein